MQKKGVSVKLTRSTDVDVSLEKRVRCASVHSEYVFVSIHANMSRNTKAHGIETFYVSDVLLSRKQKLFSKKDEAFFDNLIKMQSKESHRLASHLQKGVLQVVGKKHTLVKDRSVKPAFSQLFLGPNSVAALIEVGFLSNKKEAALLKQASYQEAIAQGICKGILAYMRI